MSKELEALNQLGQRYASVDSSKSIEEAHDDLFPIIKNALNELERLRKFRETFNAYELSKKQDFIAYENWQECEKHNDLYYRALCDIESLSISDNDELRKILEGVLT